MRNTIIVLLAAALLATGCGRSQSYYDSRMHGGPAPDRPTAAELAQEEADRAKRDAEQAKRDAEQAKREAAQAKRDAERARQEAAAAKAAQAEAEAAKAKAEAAQAEAEAEAAQHRAEQNSGDIERARREAEQAKRDAEAARAAQAEAEEAKAKAETALANAERALLEARALLRAAEADRGTQTQTPPPTQTPTPNPNPPVTAAERRALADAALEGLESAEFMQDATGVAVPAPMEHRAPADVTIPGVTLRSSGAPAGRWYVTTASHADETRRDSVLVYSDVGAPTLSDLKGYPFDLTPDRRYLTAFVTDGVSQISIMGMDGMVIPDGYKTLVESDRFPSAGSASVRFPLTRYFIDPRESYTDTPPNDRTAWFPGTFAGVPGQFQCVGTPGTPCEATRDNGGITLSAGTWTFRAAPDARASEPDTSYMYFGSWRRLTLPTGPMRYSVFSGSRSDHTPIPENFVALTGTATYTGPAIGYYAYQSNHGRFKATAKLIADFNTGSGPIAGTITGFDVNRGWSVTLKETDMTNDGNIATGDVLWTIGGRTLDGGHWNGEFHYEDEPTTIPAEMHDDYPDGIAGTFSAQHGDTGRMLGAFGAHLVE